MASPKDFQVKTAEQVTADYTRTIQNGLFNIGIENANVGEGTYDHLRGVAIGQIVEDAGNQMQLRANAQMPDSAEGEDLERICRPFGLRLRSAGPSAGFLILESSVSPVLIPEGSQLIDQNGLSYRVRIQNNYSDGDLVPILAVDTGARTNLPANSTLRWVSPPPFVASTTKVSSGGLSGGVDAESHEGLRQRLFDYLQHPPGGSNWSQVNLNAEKSSTFVAKAFCYPAVYGPSTLHVACAGSVTATDRDRSIPADILTNVITPYVLGEHPQFADITVTGCAAYPIDTIFELSIPTSAKASPPGPGGGWLDGNPFPVIAYTVGFVGTVYSSADFTVQSEAAPIVGDTVAYVSPTNHKYYEGRITGFSDMGGNIWRIQIDTPFYNDDANSVAIQLGDIVWPGCENGALYVQTVLDTFAGMGPAEKSNNATLLKNGKRKPLSEYSYPSQVGGKFLRALVQSSNEVQDASYGEPVDTVPANDTYQDPPWIAVPRHIAFYPED